jgi:hypothetical protein
MSEPQPDEAWGGGTTAASRTVVLLFGWLMASLVIVGDWISLDLAWSLAWWTGPSPQNSGLVQLWVYALTVLGMAAMARLSDTLLSKLGSFVMAMIVPAVGLLFVIGNHQTGVPPWFPLLKMAMGFGPLAAWLYGLAYREGASQSRLAQASVVAASPSPLRQSAKRVATVVLLFVLCLAHWWWLVIYCPYTPRGMNEAPKSDAPIAVPSH